MEQVLHLTLKYIVSGPLKYFNAVILVKKKKKKKKKTKMKKSSLKE